MLMKIFLRILNSVQPFFNISYKICHRSLVQVVQEHLLVLYEILVLISLSRIDRSVKLRNCERVAALTRTHYVAQTELSISQGFITTGVIVK